MPSGWRTDYIRYREFFLNVLRVYRSRPDLKSFLEITLSLATILIFSVFAIKPTILTIIELRREIAQKEETLVQLDTKLINLQSAGAILKEQSTNIGYITQSVPKTAAVDEVMKQIQGYAVQSSVEILSISSSDVVLYGEEKEKKKRKKDEKDSSLPQDAGEVPITISVTGDYQNLHSFLTTVENLRRPVKVDSFAINASLTEEGMVLVMLISGRLPYVVEIEKLAETTN